MFLTIAHRLRRRLLRIISPRRARALDQLDRHVTWLN